MAHVDKKIVAKLQQKAHRDAISKFIVGGELSLEESYDYLSDVGREFHDTAKTILWFPFDRFHANVIVDYIDSEEEALYYAYMQCAQIALEGQFEPDSPPETEELHCQSTNHKVPDDCYGTLWTCAECNKTVCCNEGSSESEGYELCDDCWYEKYGKEDSDGIN